MSSGKIIGIDLGTTNSVIAVIEENGPRIICNAEGNNLTPSVVAFDQKTAHVLVGEAAKRQAVNDPQNTIFSIKRFVGRTFDDPVIQHYVKNSPYHVQRAANGGISFRMGEQWYSPEEILAIMLRKLVHDAEEYLKESVTRVVITVPAYFNNPQREAIRYTGALAGLEVPRIINEPTAASLAAYWGEARDRTVAVYHLGGGTLDISILDVGDGVTEVRSTNGNMSLGGDDFDQRIIDWICEAFRKEEGVDLRQDTIALQRIKEAAEHAKCDLSSVMQTEINLPYIVMGNEKPKNLSMVLSRAKLDELVKDFIEQTLEPCRRALKDACLTVNDIDEVVLVGQQTRMPAVKKAVETFFNRELHHKANPAEVVALGAAVQAGVLDQAVSGVLLLDVIPFSLCVETLGGVTTKLIERNTSIPTLGSENFSTTEDNQTSITVHIVQGEREMARDNLSLGRFTLSGIPPAPRGIPRIKVTFGIDANGILNVSAKDLGTGRERAITIVGSNVVYDKTIINKVKAEADKAIHKLEVSLSKLSNQLPMNVKNTMHYKVSALRNALTKGDPDKIEDHTTELNKFQEWVEIVAKDRAEETVEQLTRLLEKKSEKHRYDDIKAMIVWTGDLIVSQIEFILSRPQKHLTPNFVDMVNNKVLTFQTAIKNSDVDTIRCSLFELNLMQEYIEALEKALFEKTADLLVRMFGRETDKDVQEKIRKALQETSNLFVHEVQLSLSKQKERLPDKFVHMVEKKILALQEIIENGKIQEVYDETSELNIVHECLNVLEGANAEKAIEPLAKLLEREADNQVRESIKQILQAIGGQKVEEILRPRTLKEKLFGQRKWIDT
jgi:molecular chaperone DnaK